MVNLLPALLPKRASYGFGLPFVRRVVSICAHLRGRRRLQLKRNWAASQSATGAMRSAQATALLALGARGVPDASSAGTPGRLSGKQQIECVQQAVELWLLPRIAPGDRACVLRVMQSVFPGRVCAAWAHHSPGSGPGHVSEAQAGPAEHDTVVVPTELRSIITSVAQQRGISLTPCQVEVCLQLFAMHHVSPEIVVLGDPGCGKSTALRILAKACRNLRGIRSITRGHRLVPVYKVVEVPVCSVSFTDLFGGYRNAHNRRLWEDGLFTRIVRQASNNFAAQRAHTWVVLDGELDPVVSDLMCSLTALRSRQGGIFEATARCAAALQCIAASRLPLTHSHLPQGTATSKWQ